MQALRQRSAEVGEGSSQVQQLRSELQQRAGQVKKLNADLEYNQEELQDLQNHCRSLEVPLPSPPLPSPPVHMQNLICSQVCII